MRSRRRMPALRPVTAEADLAVLTQHPAWPAYLQVIEKRREDMKAILVAHVLAGEKPIEAEKLMHMRGFYAGMAWALGVANGAEVRLERALQESAPMQEEAS